MTIGLKPILEFGILSVFILYFFILPVSYMSFVHCHLFSILLWNYTLLCCSWLLRHLGFLCLACLVKLDHFLSIQRTHTFFVYNCAQFLLYICLIVQLLPCYRFLDNTFISLSTNCSLVALGNKILKIWIGIIFPSLSVPVLNGSIALFWFVNVFYLCHYYQLFVNDTNWINIYHFNRISLVASCAIFCTIPLLLLLLLHTALKWFVFPTAPSCLPICWTLSMQRMDPE